MSLAFPELRGVSPHRSSVHWGVESFRVPYNRKVRCDMNATKLYKIIKSLTDLQLDRLMDLMDHFGFTVAQAVVVGYDEIVRK